MKKIFPKKLNPGDEIRIIAPSRSMTILNEETIKIATNRLNELGFKVTFGKNVNKVIDEDYVCASIQDRLEDLHEAFKDTNVKAILIVTGGFNVNQILEFIDYDLIKNNPKIICGYSDITALNTAIYAKTGLITYIGPLFFSFGMKKGFDYTLDYFKKTFLQDNEIEIVASDKWSDDAWFIDQENRKFVKNEGMQEFGEKDFEGTIIGGNLCTLNLLQGTEFMPKDNDIVLLLEDDELTGEEFFREFDRNLQSLLHSLKGKNIKGIIFGRAQNISKMTAEKWKKMIILENRFQDIPVIINADFGHTTPTFTFPIGGYIRKDSNGIRIVK